MMQMRRRSRHRALSARTALSALAFLGSACGGSASEPKPKPAPGVPANLVVIKAPPSSVQAGFAQREVLVRVTDGSGDPVKGVRVAFTVDAANSLLFAPEADLTNELGEVVTLMMAGALAGERTATITAGSSLTVNLKITVTPGPASGYSFYPYSIRLFGAGDEATFTAFTRDDFGNPVPAGPISYQVSDSTLLSVSAPATPGGSATVRALRGGGDAQVLLAGLPEVGAIPVTVFENSRTACTGIATPQTVAAGAVATAADSVLCIEQSSGAEYGLVVYNASDDGAKSIGTTVTAYNVVADFTAARLPNQALPSLSRSPVLSRLENGPTLDLRFHERLLTRSRSLRRLFPAARAVRTLARAGSTGRIRGPSYSLNGIAASVPAVDDLVSLNVAQAACDSADLRTFRVEAVGSKSVVLGDTANPGGGFTRSDYQRFAARFDTLVYPLDAGAFGDPSDIDGNGRVAILFTRAVNELTPAGASAFIGGFFHPRDLFPRTQSSTIDVCATSNEGEMFYMLAPDPSGTVNGNVFRLGFVDTLTTGVLAHEFQHLINASRRMYVNSAAQAFEETWLNEGLSHTAEELLYFRESGFTPRSRLSSQSINDTWAHFGPWVSDDASNFSRFYLYLLDPGMHSPLDNGVDLQTRGATWAFLRFAVDQSFPSDAGVWQRFGNSTTTGLGTLTLGLQRDPRPLLRDFAVANSGAPLADPRFRTLSWNYPDIFTNVFLAGAYPLQFAQLAEATAVPVGARGGSASYYKFDVPPGVQTLLKFGSSQSPPDGNLSFMVLRLRSNP
jgi:hypothetical protein